MIIIPLLLVMCLLMFGGFLAMGTVAIEGLAVITLVVIGLIFGRDEIRGLILVGLIVGGLWMMFR